MENVVLNVLEEFVIGDLLSYRAQVKYPGQEMHLFCGTGSPLWVQSSPILGELSHTSILYHSHLPPRQILCLLLNPVVSRDGRLDSLATDEARNQKTCLSFLLHYIQEQL